MKITNFKVVKFTDDKVVDIKNIIATVDIAKTSFWGKEKVSTITVYSEYGHVWVTDELAINLSGKGISDMFKAWNIKRAYDV